VSVEDTDFRIDNYFGVAKYTLTPMMQDSLNKIADMLQKDPSLSIVICGHSSPDGPEDLNMKLSSLRANEAYKWLQGKGVATSRIFRCMVANTFTTTCCFRVCSLFFGERI
jgi:outer membrane protein OmpA-like peptidoglycan-associated protein